LLFAAGITDRQYWPEEDERLLDPGIGLKTAAMKASMRRTRDSGGSPRFDAS
jgi:hypothetical protein